MWWSKLETNKGRNRPVDGANSIKETIHKFVEYFKQTGCNSTVTGNQALHDRYVSRREDYVGVDHNVDFEFSVYLVENIMINLKTRKSARPVEFIS